MWTLRPAFVDPFDHALGPPELPGGNRVEVVSVRIAGIVSGWRPKRYPSP